jgi:hypothetical protein
MLTIILNTIMWIIGIGVLVIVTGIYREERENNAPARFQRKLRKELGK